MSYLVKILDSGAVIIAPAKDFDKLWVHEYLKDKQKHRYSTTGNLVKEKISKRV